MKLSASSISVLCFAALLGVGVGCAAPTGEAPAQTENPAAAQTDRLVVERLSPICHLDTNCFNRIHPDIEPVATARPGQTIVVHTRNARDIDIVPDGGSEDPREGVSPGSTVHPLTGPIHIDGAEAGDVIAVTVLAIDPGPWGFTVLSPAGYLADVYTGRSLRALWKLGPRFRHLGADSRRAHCQCQLSRHPHRPAEQGGALTHAAP